MPTLAIKYGFYRSLSGHFASSLCGAFGRLASLLVTLLTLRSFRVDVPCSGREGIIEVLSWCLRMVILLFLVTTAVGCGSDAPVFQVREGAYQLRPTEVDLDLGVVFKGEGMYYCKPIDELPFGIRDVTEVERAVSSCECIKVSLVQFASGRSTPKRSGLRLEFSPEENGPVVGNFPSRLAVQVELFLRDGTKRVIRVNFLETLQVSQA